MNHFCSCPGGPQEMQGGIHRDAAREESVDARPMDKDNNLVYS